MLFYMMSSIHSHDDEKCFCFLYDYVNLVSKDDDVDLLREVCYKPLENIHTCSQTVIVDERLSLFLKKHLINIIIAIVITNGC